jgi:hypothetical protein
MLADLPRTVPASAWHESFAAWLRRRTLGIAIAPSLAIGVDPSSPGSSAEPPAAAYAIFVSC